MTSLKNFVNMLLAGRCRNDVISIVFGVSLIALEKKSGGVRSVAIGYTFRRIAAKCAKNYALVFLGNKLLPEQLGLGSPGGFEVSVHATRRFISSKPEDYVL